MVDLLAYLRLLHNRYDDEALLTVLASPFVGLSNDALALVRRSASKRPLFSGIEHSLPPALDERDTRLLRAFRQRFDRLADAMTRLSLERLCERIVSEHDYDLAVLAQWDGRRRYANMRKLARLARSYEELRGPDVEGFVRFVNEREAVGARELEAVAEEEGGDAVRLLTIHAAKGLEFKVVIVADAGRDRAPPSPDEILALSDGRFGFRVADPVTTKRRGAFDYDDVREARRLEEEAEKLRLYYVAMTRAKERLIVSGSIDRERKADESTPIGWVLRRLDADEELAAAGADPVEIERNGARLVVRIDRHRAEHWDGARGRARAAGRTRRSSRSSRRARTASSVRPRRCCRRSSRRPSRRSTARAASRSPRSRRSSSARTATTRGTSSACRSAGPSAPATAGCARPRSATRCIACSSRSTSPRRRCRTSSRSRSGTRRSSDDELERIRAFVASYCDSDLARRVAALEGVQKERHFTFEHDGVLLHGFVDVMHLDGANALVVDYKTNQIGDSSPEEIVEDDYSLQRLVYALACFRAGAEDVEVVYHFLERADAVVSTTFTRDQVPALEAELSAGIARIHAGEFRPTPSDFACAGCPALDLVCAGMGLVSDDAWESDTAFLSNSAA